MSGGGFAADVVVACADLIGRAGGKSIEIGWACPHTPDTAHNCPDVTWWAQAQWNGARLIRDGHPTPDSACLALAIRVLDGARCRCGEPVALTDTAHGCRWRLVGQRWEPSCHVGPIHVPGPRGDVAAMGRALNRKQRRRRGESLDG